jgi:hypothetical protein
MSLVGAIGAGPIGAGPLLLSGSGSLGGAALAAASAVAVTATGSLQAGATFASAPAVAAVATGTLTNWATVTLTAPLYVGPGGLLDPEITWPYGAPVVGDVISYDPTYITIESNSEIVSTSNNCTAVVQFFDGTRQNIATVTITPLMVGYADVVSSASGHLADDTSLSGGASDTTGATGNIIAGAAFVSAAVVAAMAAAALTNWSTVTLTAPLYTGVGGILDPLGSWTNGAPGAGAVVAYDGTNVTILPNSEIVSTLPGCTFLAQWDNGGVWSTLIVTVTPGLVAYANPSTVVTGALTTAVQMAAAAMSLVVAAAPMSTRILATAAPVSNSSAAGGLTTGIQLAASLVSTTVASAALPGGAAALSGNGTDTIAVTAILATGIQAAAAAADSTSAVAILSTAILTAASAISNTSAGAALTTGELFSAAASDSSSAAGALDTAIHFIAAAIALSSAVGALSAQLNFVATAPNSVIASGQLSAQIRMSGIASSLAEASAGMTAQIEMLSAAISTVTAGAALRGTAAALQGAGQVISAAQANVTTLIQASANALSASAAAGMLSTQVEMGGDALVEASASSTLIQINWNGPVNLIRAPQPGVTLWAGPLPYGAFYQRGGARLIYAIDWEDWLGIRWAPLESVSIGQVVRPTRDMGYQFRCVFPGTTDTEEPSWVPYVGEIVGDGGAQWECEPLDSTSLIGTVVDATWTAPTGVLIAASTIVDQMTLALIDTTNASVNESFDAMCTVDTSDAQRAIGLVRIRVRA